MNIFITGASGYIGSILIESLSKQFRIVAASQKKITPSLVNKNIRYKIVNYKSIKSLKKNLIDIDVVIHLVGMNKTECEKKKSKSLLFKKKITLNIVKACRYHNIKKIIYLSSSQVYKDFQKKSINEKSKLDKTNFYSLSHILAEKIIIDENIECYNIIRASNIFGLIKKKEYKKQNENLIHSLFYSVNKYNNITLKKPNVTKNFLPISIFVSNIKTIIKSNKYDKKIINLGFKSMNLYSLAQTIKSRIKNLKNKKIDILIKNKLDTKKNNHNYSSLVKKFSYSPKKFTNELDNVINLLMKKTIR
jgi:nucleoside-diphosphate-sugar epimerase|tara:strand:+ start:1127 stop:2041 length:915 start_codon:yes stop_codon:yes gene_type:complete